jgi:hypothetical protein
MSREPDQPRRSNPPKVPPPYAQMALHAVAAGTFFFVLNRFGFSQTTETSLLWAAIAAPFAAYLAYQQAQR